MTARKTKKTRIEALTHDEKTRTNIPTAELESLADESNTNLDKLSYERRNNPDVNPVLYDRDRDLDPQLVWRGKDDEDRLPLTIDFSPVYIHEKIHPKTIIDDIRRRSYDGNVTDGEETPNLFSEWAGELSPDDKIEFYKHDLKWANRLILGDSLQVMNSLATKEEIKGKVQCVFLDPPYGIKFNSNWQTSIGKRNSGEGDISREPESIKAFRDTWKDGYNSYLSYLRDRLIVSHELLSETGAIFLQIGEENFHRAKSLLDEVFGASNCVATISFVKTTSQTAKYLPIVCDYILFYAKNIDQLKFRKLYRKKDIRTSNYFMTDFGQQISRTDIEKNSNVSSRMYKPDNLTSQSGGGTTKFTFDFRGEEYPRRTGGWKTNSEGMKRLSKANRIHIAANSIRYVRYFGDFEYTEISSSWTDTTTGNFTEDKMYVVQTSEKVISRCLSMASDPGDIVLDPTCGSGTTGIVAERLGRRWILVDTSRVAINISRQRLMGAKYPYYATKDIELNEDIGKVNMKFSNLLVGKISSGFHFEKAPRITLRSIANNVLIDDIDERYSTEIESLLEKLNSILPEQVNLWNLPYEKDITESDTRICYNKLIEVLRNKQRDIDAAITDGAETETLYDSPVEIPNITRVTGPFTVESLSPHKMLPTDDNTCIPSEDTMNAAPPPQIEN